MNEQQALHERYAEVFQRADLGDPVSVWYCDGKAMTDLGPVRMPKATPSGELENVGPIVLIRRSIRPTKPFFEIAGAGLVDGAKTALKIDKESRQLYLKVTAGNGSWTWQLRRGSGAGHFEIDGYDLYVGVWRD